MIITNARIFNGRKFIKANTVEIKGNKIKRVYYTDNYKKGINIHKLILSPALIDIHTHSSDIDILDINSRKDIIRFKQSYLKNGTTSFIVTTFYKKNNKKIINIIKQIQKIKIGSRCLGIYFEGPFINMEKKGAIPLEYINADAQPEDIKKEYENIKLMTIAPEIKNFKKVINKIKSYHIIPSFGHSIADYNLVLKSIEYGIRNVTHLFNAMPKWYEYKPPVYKALLKEKNVFVEIIADSIHIPPKILRLIYKKFGKERIILISDKVNNKYLLNKNKKINSKLYLIDIVRNMKKVCRLTNEKVLQLATYNPARLLNLKNTGLIKKDFLADLLILNDNLHIEKIIFNGRIIL